MPINKCAFCNRVEIPQGKFYASKADPKIIICTRCVGKADVELLGHLDTTAVEKTGFPLLGNGKSLDLSAYYNGQKQPDKRAALILGEEFSKRHSLLALEISQAPLSNSDGLLTVLASWDSGPNDSIERNIFEHCRHDCEIVRGDNVAVMAMLARAFRTES